VRSGEPAAVARAVADEHPPAAVVPYSSERLVLYVEDVDLNVTLVRAMLTHRPMVRLISAIQGGLGLELARDHHPDLILLDMHLPDIDGLQLLRMLKDDAATAAVPVVVVSADAVSARIKAALEAGAEQYLTKPVNVAELLRLIDELLEQRDTLFG
jgi:CheY-like chemotaxis protein